MSAARHVVVTGGTGALGAAVVARLLSEGTRCTVTYLEPRELERFALASEVAVQRVDCCDELAVRTFYAGLPQLDASIHLVGGFAMAQAVDTTLAQFDALLRLNAASAFLCSREAVARMRGHGGRIVNVAARPALEPAPGMLAYSISKAAVVALTRALAIEVVGDAILVNAVVPSTMDTPANRRAMPDEDPARWPKVEEVAEAIAFLAGPRNTVTSGALVPVYGRA